MATIYAVYIGDINRIATDTVIMYCHGNADHLDFYWPRAKLLANVGSKNRYGVMMIDYRGYGLSDGKASESGLYADVDTALAWLKSKGLTDSRLIMYGFSLGTAPAVELTAHPRSLTPAKLILEAPFSSSETMVQNATLLSLPGSYFVNAKINNAEKIKEINQPFLWLHGTDDEKLEIKTHGEVVYKNYPGSSKFAYRIPGAGHSDLPIVMGLENYKKAIEDFVKN
jgi:pimeloyl-ACP methyl ester carboxylesterase